MSKRKICSCGNDQDVYTSPNTGLPTCVECCLKEMEIPPDFCFRCGGSCGYDRRYYHEDMDGNLICSRCYRKDPTNYEDCSICKKYRYVCQRDPKGGAICTNCYTKDTANHEKCCGCGRLKFVAKRGSNGEAICQACYRKDPTNHEDCSKCGRRRYVAKRGPNGEPYCFSCYKFV